jgi:Raf kinase inhibitor-like YbhB/YbcL family protein
MKAWFYVGQKSPRARSVVRAALFILLAFVVGLLACNSSAIAGDTQSSLELASSSFVGGDIPKKCTCDGPEVSPELSWGQPPAGTQSFALIVIDLNSLFGFKFVHWIVYDLPPQARELPEALPKEEQLPDGSRQGRTDFDKIGYGGPCPPGKSAHRYSFVLYALDSKLGLPAGAKKKQVEKAMKNHILAQGELIGRYQH